MDKNMSREEMLRYAMEHPFEKISHSSFLEDEYIYTDGGTFFYDENGYLFENRQNGDGIHNGLRIRNFGNWIDGWYVKEQEVRQCD